MAWAQQLKDIRITGWSWRRCTYFVWRYFITIINSILFFTESSFIYGIHNNRSRIKIFHIFKMIMLHTYLCQIFLAETFTASLYGTFIWISFKYNLQTILRSIFITSTFIRWDFYVDSWVSSRTSLLFSTGCLGVETVPFVLSSRVQTQTSQILIWILNTLPNYYPITFVSKSTSVLFKRCLFQLPEVHRLEQLLNP